MQCSSGFIADPRNKKLVCPDCRAMSCAKCLLPVSSRITHWNIPFPSYHFVLCNTYLLCVVCMTTIVEFKVKKATWTSYLFLSNFLWFALSKPKMIFLCQKSAESFWISFRWKIMRKTFINGPFLKIGAIFDLLKERSMKK